jgi:hypothetical protein
VGVYGVKHLNHCSSGFAVRGSAVHDWKEGSGLSVPDSRLPFFDQLSSYDVVRKDDLPRILRFTSESASSRVAQRLHSGKVPANRTE